MFNLRKHNISKDQRGLVSIIVVMIIIIVLSLIVIGFAQIARREQRQALDRQLSDQAQYAAESGINDAVEAIKTGALTVNDETCAEDTFNYNVDASTGVEITCLLVKQDPPTLKYQLGTSQSTYFEMNFPSSANSITISWKNRDGSFSTPSSYPSLPAMGAWGGDKTGMLKVTFTHLELGAVKSYTRDDLNNNSLTAYLYPENETGPVPLINFGSRGPSEQGQIINSFCDASTGYCSAKIVGLNTTKAFMRLTAIYKDLDITVEGKDVSSGSLNISGAQAHIDVTAKANDVVKRIYATVPAKNYSTNVSKTNDYAVQSVTGICKLLSVAPGYGSDSCP